MSLFSINCRGRGISILFLIFLLGLSLNLSPVARAGTLRYNPEYFDKILVEAEIGKIRIEGNGEGLIETTQNLLWKDSDCELYSELDDHTLKIKLGVKDGDKVQAALAHCEALIVIKIPSIKDIEIKAGTPDIFIEGMKGKSKISLRKGGLNINSDLAEMEVRGDAVNLTSSGLIAKMRVELDQKNLNLEMKRLGSSALHRVALDISALKTDVIFPSHAKVKTRFTGDGIQARVKSDFTNPTDQDQVDFELKINSDSGEVGIKKI
ncbi:MAG: hypothetical protein ABIQ95_01825 [Bdellovibrionia bacterium]